VTHLRRIMGRNSSLVITLRLPYGITLARSKPSLGSSNALLIAWAPQHTREYQARLFARTEAVARDGDEPSLCPAILLHPRR
jgi:hypothetical protein